MKRILSLILLIISTATSNGQTDGIVYPPDAGVTDIKRDFGARGDGITDDTSAIQNALRDRRGVIYFPEGTYLISSKLEWKRSAHGTTSRQIFQGQSMERTVIRLKDHCPGFQDPGQPQEMIWTGKAPAQSFRNGIRNLTIDSGTGNPGAIGARFYANNQGGMHHVHIRSGDGGGVIGLDLGHASDQGPMLIRNVRVTGFDTGIHTRFGTTGVTAEHIRLENQKVVGWLNSDQPVYLRGFTSNNAVTALENRGATLVTLLDAQLTGGNPQVPAIINDTGMYARNVKASGYSRAIGGKRAAEGMEIVEWTSHPPLSVFPSPPKGLSLPVRETPGLPWDDPSTWVNVRKYAPADTVPMLDVNGKSKSLPDWTASFQKAIDSGATTVFFPKGDYTFNGTVMVRGNVRRIMGLNSTFGNRVGKCELVVADGHAPTVLIEDFDWMYSNVQLRHVSKRELVLSAIAGGHHEDMEVSVTAEAGHGDLFLQDIAIKALRFKGGNVWARQLDPEGGYKDVPRTPRGTYDSKYDMILNDGATLWIWGLKTEGDGTVITTTNGGKTEVCGFIYANKDYRPEKQWLVNDNSSVSASLVEMVIRKRPFDPVLERRGAETRILAQGVAPGRGGGSLVVLYTGYPADASSPDALPNPSSPQRSE